jgi:hypothetical protein
MNNASMPALLSVLALSLAGYTGDVILAVVACSVAALSAWASIETICLRRMQRLEIELRLKQKKP